MPFATAAARFARTAFAAGALTAASAAAAAAQTPSGNDFIAAGGTVTVRYLGSEVADVSTLAFRVGTFSAAATDYINLFTNNGPGASPVGSQFVIGNVAAGTPIVFRLTNSTQNLVFFSGPASRNQDNREHVGLLAGTGDPAQGGGTFTQGFNFEDRSGTTPPLADFDYDDLRFEIANAQANVIPEPGTVALMGAGLAVLGGAAARRRKATDA